MPNAFLPIAKQSRHYNKITRIVINKAFEFFKDKKDISFSINISFEDIKDEDFVKFLFNKLKKCDINLRQRVIFEILEDEDVMNSFEFVNNFFKKIRTFGCKIAIDDFGVGYSNISNILSMDIDIIKIDGAIIRKIDEAEDMIKGIVQMSNKKGIQIIGEFVEDQKKYDTIKKLNFHGGQGYFIGKPDTQLVE